jgi:hypothetical protein
LICDRASRVVVHAFPMSELAAVCAAGLLAAPGTYIMTDGRIAYVGESARVSRRLADHSADPSKIFARDAFVVCGCDGSTFDKSLALDFQFRLTRQAVDCGVVAVANRHRRVAPRSSSAIYLSQPNTRRGRSAGDIPRTGDELLVEKRFQAWHKGARECSTGVLHHTTAAGSRNAYI